MCMKPRKQPHAPALATVGEPSTESAANPWLANAYEVFTRDGLGAIKVEALARELGLTKGSFYWHYASRQELINAVIQRWEHDLTSRLITLSESAGDNPEDRIRSLFEAVAQRPYERRGEMLLYTEARDEHVQDAVARVTQRRIAFLAELLEDTGHDHTEALRRSVIALALTTGIAQILDIGPRAPQTPGLSSTEITNTLLAMVLSKNL
jgi:AcrR family transcriptional regulator